MSNSFILNFLPEYPNTKFNNEVLNKFTKELYNTGMFNKISLKVDNNTTITLTKSAIAGLAGKVNQDDIA